MPAADKNSEVLLLHFTGWDRPGITATLTEIVAQEKARLIDIGQTVIHGHLTLSAMIELPPTSDVLRKLLVSARELGFRVELSPLSSGDSPEKAALTPALCVTLLGNLHEGSAVAQTARFFAAHHMNIREIRSLDDEGLHGLEFIVSLPPHTAAPSLTSLRGEILQLSQSLGVDMAVQLDDIFRHNKRLVCMDVDSTFVQMEVIDELARLQGAAESVARITERAMQGELDFRQALAERVNLLKGLPYNRALELLNNVPLTPGVESFVRSLKSLGFQVGLVSGGFDFFVDALKSRFDLDFAVSNQLEVRDGVLTGRTLGSVVDAERKAQVLKDMSQAFRCRLEQSIAIGDGANDLLMLQIAGLGIAFQGKPKLREAAHMSLSQNPLDSVLFLMGYHARHFKSL